MLVLEHAAQTVPDLFGEVPLLLAVQLEHHDSQVYLLGGNKDRFLNVGLGSLGVSCDAQLEVLKGC